MAKWQCFWCALIAAYDIFCQAYDEMETHRGNPAFRRLTLTTYIEFE